MLKIHNGKEFEIKGLFIARNYSLDASPWALFWALGPGRGIPEDIGSYKAAQAALKAARTAFNLPIVDNVTQWGGI